MQDSRLGIVLSGIVLIASGTWLLAVTFGAPLAGFDRVWPIILTLFGCTLLIQYWSGGRAQRGLLFVGVNATLLGVFLCFFTFRIGHLSWQDMSGYWPVIPIIIGLAFMALYLADDMQERTLLIPVFILGGIGTLTLPVTLGILRSLAFRQTSQLWPLLVILMVLILFSGPLPRDDQASFE